MADDFNPYYTWLGIPLTEQPPNRYRLLGLAPFESDSHVIAHAADRQMGYVRTFQSGTHSALSQKILNELASAKICLLNQARREAYDVELRAALAEKEAKELPAPPVAPPPPAQEPEVQQYEQEPPATPTRDTASGIEPLSAKPESGIRPRPGRTPDGRTRPALERLRPANTPADRTPIGRAPTVNATGERVIPTPRPTADEEQSDEYTVLPLLPDEKRRAQPEPTRKRRPQQRKKALMLPVVFFAALIVAVLMYLVFQPKTIVPGEEPAPPPTAPQPKPTPGAFPIVPPTSPSNAAPSTTLPGTAPPVPAVR